MIDSIKGKVASRRADHVVLDCNGVGYRLSVSAQTLDRVPATGRAATLLSHLVLRDDGIHLYGFATESERELFLRLISVSGIGPKMALTALSGSSADELRQAIAAGDAKRFQVVPGIGRKTAERVIVELRDLVAGDLASANGDSAVARGGARALAREGLVGLGYDSSETESMLDAAARELPDGSPEELIAAALRAAVKAP